MISKKKNVTEDTIHIVSYRNYMIQITKINLLRLSSIYAIVKYI